MLARSRFPVSVAVTSTTSFRWPPLSARALKRRLTPPLATSASTISPRSTSLGAISSAGNTAWPGVKDRESCFPITSFSPRDGALAKGNRQPVFTTTCPAPIVVRAGIAETASTHRSTLEMRTLAQTGTVRCPLYRTFPRQIVVVSAESVLGRTNSATGNVRSPYGTGFLLKSTISTRVPSPSARSRTGRSRLSSNIRVERSKHNGATFSTSIPCARAMEVSSPAPTTRRVPGKGA